MLRPFFIDLFTDVLEMEFSEVGLLGVLRLFCNSMQVSDHKTI